MVLINKIYWYVAHLKRYHSDESMSESLSIRSKFALVRLPLGIITILIVGVIASDPG